VKRCDFKQTKSSHRFL